jgi:hypothetical protein
MRIYLDVCCMNRPFDDRRQERIRLESEAILSILTRCQTGDFTLLKSEVTDIEILKIPDRDRREKVRLLPKLSDFFTPHKGGGEAEKPFRAITFDCLNQPRGLFNHHLLGEPLRSIALSFNVSHSKRFEASLPPL